MLAKAPPRTLARIKRFRLFFMKCEPVMTGHLSPRVAAHRWMSGAAGRDIQHLPHCRASPLIKTETD
jgi:hypothetical protein